MVFCLMTQVSWAREIQKPIGLHKHSGSTGFSTTFINHHRHHHCTYLHEITGLYLSGLRVLSPPHEMADPLMKAKIQLMGVKPCFMTIAACFLDPGTCPQAPPMSFYFLLLLVVVLSDLRSAKASSFHSRSSPNFALHIGDNTLSTIARWRIFQFGPN